VQFSFESGLCIMRNVLFGYIENGSKNGSAVRF